MGDYRGRAARGRLYRELAGNRYALLGIVCSGEVVMAKWKWVLARAFPPSFSSLTRTAITSGATACTWERSAQFVLFRSGLAGSGAVRTLVRLISFPFTLLYLLLYATSVHARRACADTEL